MIAMTNIPLYSVSCSTCTTPNLYALDTETTRFNEPVLGWKGKTRLKPFGGHKLVLGSICGCGKLEVYHRADFITHLLHLLADPANEFIFHNAAFDIPVLCAAESNLLFTLNHAIDSGRIHDTQILEVLLQIAIGSRTMSQKQLVNSPSLKSLALKRADMDLSKDPTIRLGFDRYMDPATPIPEVSLIYASLDAKATYLVYKSQKAEAELLSSCCVSKFPRFADSNARFGLLSESVQIKGALGLAWLEQFPIRVDQRRACATRDKLELEIQKFEDALIFYKWGRRTPKSKKFQCSYKHLRKILLQFAQEHSIIPEYSPTGQLSLSHDFWTKHLPKIPKNLYEAPLEAKTVEDQLIVWLRYIRARKLLSTYIYVYSSAEHHYPTYQNIGARTGRISCHRPNVMNIPKRRDGIRALFIPAEKHVLLEADWDWAELVSLAQVYHEMYGGSVLEEMINSGEDPHIARARTLIEDYALKTKDEQKKLRQSAKAVNFGLPGGLGAETFQKYAESTWDVHYSLEEAKAVRRKALSTDPQLTNYLNDQYSLEGLIKLVCTNLELPVSRLMALTDAYEPNGAWDYKKCYHRILRWLKNEDTLNIPLPIGCKKDKRDLFLQTTTTLTGRIRGKSTFTSAHNTPFQGLVSDAGKIAIWNLYEAWCVKPLFTPVAFIHDSILVQCYQSDLDDVKLILNSCMISALNSVCPNIKCGIAFTECGTRWGSNTSPWGEEEL